MKGPVGLGGSGVSAWAGGRPSVPKCSLVTTRIRAARPDNSRGGPTVDNGTRWVGIDLHRRRSFPTAITEEGEVEFRRRIVNEREAFLELLGDPNGTHVALEATYGWEWLADLLEDAGYALHLAHPLRTRAIAAARVKTDAVDATTLAQLLRAGLLPEAYIAPRELRDVRELLRHRVTLVAMRSAIKNRVHAILAKHGVTHQHSDLFGKAGRQFLTTVELRQAFERIAKRRGRKVARVAVARQILTLCYYGLRDGEIRCLKASRPGEPHESLGDPGTPEPASSLDHAPGAGTQPCARSGELV